jgi:CRP/FNR family cyclic AMP-dependent transcriptional regulator
MDLTKIIRGVDLFEGLTSAELDEIISICQQRRFQKGDLLAVEGEIGDEIFIVMEGTVEIIVNSGRKTPKVVIHLGVGQLIGEMSLVDRGPRSATVRAIEDPTIVQVIRHQDFHTLCKRNYRIGYIVMHNMAADLSFKLRHRHLSEG